MSKKVVDFNKKRPNSNFPQVWDISPHDVLSHLTDVHLVDVRRPDEYRGELGHIRGTKLMTLDRLSQMIEQLPKNETIVFICKSGGRSAQATAFAQSLGFKSVYNMAGGMLAWTENQFEVEDQDAG